MLYILYQAGTYGSFLTFLLDNFSKLTPSLNINPLDKNEASGLSATHSSYGGTAGMGEPSNIKTPKTFFRHYHENFIEDSFRDKWYGEDLGNRENLNVCPILINNPSSYLLYSLTDKIRAGNVNANPDYLWQKTKDECRENKGLNIDIFNLQNKHYVNHKNEKFSKKEIRDWYLQVWRQPLKDNISFKKHDTFKNHIFFTKQKTLGFPIEGFMYWDTFISSIKKLNNFFNLEIDFTKENEMKDIFEQGILKDFCKQDVINVDKIISAVQNKSNIEIKELNVLSEAYVIAYVERILGIKLESPEIFYQNTKEFI